MAILLYILAPSDLSSLWLSLMIMQQLLCTFVGTNLGYVHLGWNTFQTAQFNWTSEPEEQSEKSENREKVLTSPLTVQ